MRKFLLIVVLLALVGCGGSGGGGASTPAVVNNPGSDTTNNPSGNDSNPSPTTTTLLKVTSDGPAGSAIASISVTIAFPAGSSVKTDKGVVLAEVVQASGVAAGIADTSFVDFTAATQTTSGKLNFMVIDNNKQTPQFGVGEFATVQLLTTAPVPAGTEFQVVEVVARDSSGKVIDGITAKAAVK